VLRKPAFSALLVRPVADCLPLLQAPGQLLAKKIFNDQAEAEIRFKKFVSSRTSDFKQR
jgi:hypothetical protein